MKEICKIIADYHSIPYYMLFTKTRKRRIVLPRQIAMYIIRNRPGMSLHKTGAFFEKDHATVIHAVKTIESLMSTYPKFKADVEFLIGYTAGIEINPYTLVCRPYAYKAKAVKI